MSYDSEVLADSPLFYCKLDETSGTTMTDSSGNGRDGFYFGATLNQAALVNDGGRSALGTASGQGIGTLASAAWMEQNNFTAECWVKPNNTNGGKSFFSRFIGGNMNWALFQDLSQLRFILNSSQAVTPTTYTVGATYHLVGTYDGTNLRLYVNGSLVATTATAQSGTNGQPMQVGGHSGANYSQATVDNVAFYAGALSGTRIAAHYSAGLALSRSLVVGTAVETDSGLKLATLRRAGTAVETDAAMKLLKLLRVGVAVETDSARPVIAGHRIVKLAVETDLAWPLRRAVVRVVGVTAETDSAWSVAALVGVGVAALYADLGDVVDGLPEPVIWWLGSGSARPGDQVSIVGVGFGMDQAEFDGAVEVYDWQTDSWTEAPVESWLRVAADPVQAAGDGSVDEVAKTATPEHGEIILAASDEWRPPGYGLRVRVTG
jgi:hypothetical protein